MFVLTLLLTLSYAGFDLNKKDYDLFKEFEVVFNKKYLTPTERLHRFSIFKEKIADCRHRNSLRTSESDAYFNINQFTDMIEFETGLSPKRLINMKKSNLKKDDLPILPAGNVLPPSLSYCGPYVNQNTDHPKIDFCGKPINQLSCGCCYAAAIANHGQIMYANMTYYKNNKDESKIQKLYFTPQRFIDKEYSQYGFSNKRCCGGNSGIAITGMPTYSLQSDYPFVDGTTEYYTKPAPCTPRGDQNEKVPIYMRNYYPQVFSVNQAGSHANQVMALKKIIHHYGSVLVAIQASGTGIQQYQSGIFTFPAAKCDKPLIDHQVILVGYGKENGKEYFIARNTWGESWGENGGFAKISMDVMCGMAQDDWRGYESQNYIFHSGSCVLDPNCETCNKNTLICDKCRAGSNQDSRGMCVAPGQYDFNPSNPVNPPAVTCLSGCVKCTNATICETCAVGKYLKNDRKACLTACPNGQYPNNNKVCVACSTANCATCGTNNVCTACKSGYQKTASNTCQLIPCGDGKFGTSPNCQNCLANCKTCTSGAVCELCTGTYKLQEDKKKCLATCPTGAYVNGNYCKKCTTKNCNTCNNKNVCTKCIAGFELTATTNQCTSPSGACGEGEFGTAGNCKKCGVANCKMCNNAETCEECTGALNLEFGSKKCSQSCPSGFYSDNQKCLKCQENCESCQSGEICDKCKADVKFKVEGKCYAVCPDYYFEENGECVKCKESYETPCNDQECIKCTTPQQKNGATKMLGLFIFVIIVLFI
ncbi:cysteine protease, putative [Entamoeba invadens IP1]|uniref:Cysteine protease, putative n=1 Tax=Entamoeba invadens IP1 TaxID=370355 RepID=L7FM76_ENTIV|nr:cysteine protease, putative [Entamoeba invadens IP1]ELP88715.1 cysteine protease, putative [Entamoeba invadens IP1]|eukprot:XP_004255486.1 cysteine protease, putative [Entamoeba invadens IP1]